MNLTMVAEWTKAMFGLLFLMEEGIGSKITSQLRT